MKISKKIENKLRQISVVDTIIKKFDDDGREIGGSHWIDTPPDMWTKEETALFDLMNELEMEFKRQVFLLFGITE